jgi:hypothetical protein
MHLEFSPMKASKTFRVLTLVMLLPLLSGCFTAIVSREAVGSKSDWFSPTALYKSKTDGSLAVEGTLTKAGEQGGAPAYLIIPQEVLVAAHLQTKGNVTFNDITSLPPRVRQELCLRKKLNSDYEKIASVQNQGGMDVNREATVNIKAVGLLPFAFVVDAVTFPLQIYIGKKMSENPIE